MQSLPLQLRDGHLFITIEDRDWLFDTGAPASFGRIASLTIGGEEFRLPTGYMGLTAAVLSEYVGHSTVGIIGADVINGFDTIVDVPNERVSFSAGEIDFEGDAIATDEFMGVPIVEVTIDGAIRKMFFDTGAQISYFQDDSLTGFPPAGTVSDFYPGFGQFQTQTYLVDVTLGMGVYTLRCGALPGLLGMTLGLAGTEGIVGNEILRDRIVAFFPPRKRLVLA